MQPFFLDLDRQLRRARKEAETLLESRRRNEAKALGAGDYIDQWTSVSALASGIEKVYSGLERTLRLIASRIDGDVPNDPEWHMTLLQRMAEELPGVRPPVLSKDSLQILDRLRAFRHRERDSYAQDLDPVRVLEVADLVLPAVGRVEPDSGPSSRSRMVAPCNRAQHRRRTSAKRRVRHGAGRRRGGAPART